MILIILGASANVWFVSERPPTLTDHCLSHWNFSRILECSEVHFRPHPACEAPLMNLAIWTGIFHYDPGGEHVSSLTKFITNLATSHVL